jgi:hypothetical protein
MIGVKISIVLTATNSLVILITAASSPIPFNILSEVAILIPDFSIRFSSSNLSTLQLHPCIPTCFVRRYSSFFTI